MLTDFISFGTIAFWVFALIVLVFLIITFEIHEGEKEDTGGGRAATLILIVAAAAYYLLGSKEYMQGLWLFITNHTGTFFLFVMAYFGVGVIWSFFKWFFYLRKVREYYDRTGFKIDFEDIPVAKKNVNRISTWISFWIVSMFWTLVNDPVRKFCQFLVNTFGSWYDKMSQQAFAETVKIKKPNNKNIL